LHNIAHIYWRHNLGKESFRKNSARIPTDARRSAHNAEALAWGGNPMNNLAPLANAKIPLLIVCSDADETVSPEENALIVEHVTGRSAARWR